MPARAAARTPDELAFLRTITADLSNPLPQLVYADWLEERGDPLGPFLRQFVEACGTNDPIPDEPEDTPEVWAQVLGLPLRRKLRTFSHANAGLLLANEGSILRAIRPCVGMTIRLVESTGYGVTGCSRVGGLPDLPDPSLWPTHSEGEIERPMQFLFQIDLRDLQGTFAEDFLPSGGLLSVFHYPKHEASRRRIVYSPPGEILRRAELPAPEPWHNRITWPGQKPLFAESPFPVVFEDVCPLNGLGETMTTDAQAEVELVTAFIEFCSQRRRWMGSHSHTLCEVWHQTRCPQWRELHPRLPHGHYRLARLGIMNRPYDWSFGDSDPLHLFARAEDTKAGNFNEVVTHEYLPPPAG